MESKTYILDALNAIPVASTNYQEWCNVGMALKLEGFGWQVWDDWSRPDSRYRPGNCEKKWQSFHAATASPVTGGTIVAMAKDHGWVPNGLGAEIGWDDVISAERDDLVVVDKNWLEG